MSQQNEALASSIVVDLEDRLYRPLTERTRSTATATIRLLKCAWRYESFQRANDLIEAVPCHRYFS